MAEDPAKSDSALKEEKILSFWQEHNTFEKSLEKEAPNGEFVFYDGPPFATGLPHSGSLLSSVSKDLIPRYKTMRGYRVRRRWGWDTHGLPIESLVEKELGLKNKKDILALGIEKFNETARQFVLAYVNDWKRYVERVGRWVDFDNSYKTMDNSYIESVWWGLKQIHDKGNLYEGRKVLMYCPHCETPLAKAEIAMDNTYKDVTEEAVTVKFKVKGEENLYILAWTTTPWTLPGNVALAVGPDISYGEYELNGEHLIAATERAETLGLSNLVRTYMGSELVGKEYEPLYEIAKVQAHQGKKWCVLSADFVTTGEGTGIVHTAVIYGEDDYNLGVKEGLPMVPILNSNATYNVDVPEFLQGKYIKKAEVEIKEDLETRGLLFAKAPNTHSYPHCYRCSTPLIYNAVSSWFINIQAIKEKMIAENEKINWIPEHLKHGRFAHILDTAPDWTISRNRFWASPLPIWKDAAGNVTVVGSLAELQKLTKKSGNTYYAMRHGEAENNVRNELDSTDEQKWGLTDKGKKEVEAAIVDLKDAGIEVIYASPFTRTQETARMIAEGLGLSVDSIVTDDRLKEIQGGELSGKPIQDFLEYRTQRAYGEAYPGGESHIDAKKRFGEFLYEIERTQTNKKILIVTHGIGLEMFAPILTGADEEATKKQVEVDLPKSAEVRKLDFVPLPHNRTYELDYHLPYIDELELVTETGEPLTRIPEVVDCWVESGSMPFAEYHYPFENKEQFEKRSPGDFISEYIAQTRAWFYYLHAIGVQVFDRAAFKNVITTGNILAADGNKFSKSKKNYTDPYVLIDRFSADAFRFYLMSSVVMQAEDLTFKDDEMKDAQNRVVNMLRNVLAFYELFKDQVDQGAVVTSDHVLDRWIVSRLNEVMLNATESFDRYDVPRAVRPMRDFIDDLSTWYVRRSRDRVKGGDTERALGTLRFVLKEFSKVIAPVMPFIAEEVFQAVRGSDEAESVHLAEWPTAGSVDTELTTAMEQVRAVASEALMLRQKTGIKVRQPLGVLEITTELSPELSELIKEEINVKEVRSGSAEMKLDTTLTPELIKEGDVREFARALADARKEAGLQPKDMVSVTASENAQGTLEGIQLPGLSHITFGGEGTHTATLSFGSISFTITPDAA